MMVEPGRQPLEVFMPFGQHAGLHQHLPDVVDVAAGFV
jgi:hypothetical protein